MNVLWEQQAMQVQKRPQDGRKAPQAARIRLTVFFFFNTSANMDPQLHVNSISRPPVQSGRQRKTLTFTGGVRILPRLVLLAVIFAAAHYVCSAAEQETPV